jgi:AP2-associated kinase
LKVENVLIASSRCYKLCDFGSAATPRAAGTTAQECRAIEEDIQKHTTLQYRSPEMVDVYRRLPIDEKSDIWALGVFLYKLCYYTTPFEDKGTLAILNAKFVFPPFPSYSTKIKNLIGIFQGNGLTIAWTLRENPKDRPNIYEVVKAVCILRGSEVPIRDVFSFPSFADARYTLDRLLHNLFRKFRQSRRFHRLLRPHRRHLINLSKLLLQLSPLNP